jgi:hypothetical protein
MSACNDLGHPKIPRTPRVSAKASPTKSPTRRRYLTRTALPQASRPLPRSKKRIRFGNAYTRPEYQALFKIVRKRSGGVCEICCAAPAVGWGHHTEYADFKGWKRIIVAPEKILDACHECHVRAEAAKVARVPVSSDFLGA